MCTFKRREVLRGCGFILWIRNLIEVRKNRKALQIRKVQTLKSYLYKIFNLHDELKRAEIYKWEYFRFGKISKNSSDLFILTATFPDLNDAEMFTQKVEIGIYIFGNDDVCLNIELTLMLGWDILMVPSFQISSFAQKTQKHWMRNNAPSISIFHEVYIFTANLSSLLFVLPAHGIHDLQSISFTHHRLKLYFCLLISFVC